MADRGVRPVAADPRVAAILRVLQRGLNHVAYQFAGFFARPVVPRPEILPEGAVWRTITAPFVGVGVRLPSLIGAVPSPVDVYDLAQQLGLLAADGWLYLTYNCWWGQVDFVYGLGSLGGEPFGPVWGDNKTLLDAEIAYTDLMEQIGISHEDAHSFEPFQRGYWGDT